MPKFDMTESAAIYHHMYYGNRTGINNGLGAPMNIQKQRLANTQHILTMQRGGSRVSPYESFNVGEQLTAFQDVNLSVEEGVVSVPKGSVATVKESDSASLLIDLGEALGSYVIPRAEVSKYFERRVVESRNKVNEANDIAQTPGRRVTMVRYDPAIGINRGPKSPGMGGYETLVGQQGEIQSLYGMINGIRTYRVNLVSGGQFILGETELQVVESTSQKSRKPLTEHDLIGLGLGL